MASLARSKPPIPTAGGRKGGTESTRHHRFESFSQRIAKLNIDPVRRVRRHDLDDIAVSATASYFQNALDEWGDLNTSENFVDFVRAISPVCDSLPQVVHFQDKIADLLVQYLDKRDALSLQPLLALLAHFAHDLGARFEKHFSRLVALVTSIAARHSDVEVIEWSFSCLAWLFKYLSRLLVPNLRPVFDLMAPLLGKDQQKPFVIRFAAEALSFLVRKAATHFHKDQAPLEIVTRHAFEDLQAAAESRTVKTYQQGLMTLFAEAIKGISRGIHTSGGTVLACMLRTVKDVGIARRRVLEDLICGVIINVIHHTDADTFAPIMHVVLASANDATSEHRQEILFAARLLFVVAGVRKGSRVKQWQALFGACLCLLRRVTNSSRRSQEGLTQIGFTFAVLLQYSPIDAFLSLYQQTMDLMVGNRANFLPFCTLCAGLGGERFRQFVLPYLPKFISLHWNEAEQSMCMLLENLADTGCLVDPLKSADLMPCHILWQDHMAGTFDVLLAMFHNRHSGQDHRWLLLKCKQYLDIAKYMSFEPSNRTRILADLRQMFLVSIQGELAVKEDMALFAVGQGLVHYASDSRDDPVLDPTLWPFICASGAAYATFPAFLDGLLLYLGSASKSLEIDPERTQPLLTALFNNLSAPSHELRARTLQLLRSLHLAITDRESETLSLALLIEETPLNLQTARAISMHVRRLAARFDNALSDPWLVQVVPRFCFGLLSYKLSQVWDDATAALKDVAQTKEGEERVAELAFKWLEATPNEPAEGVEKAVQSSQRAALTPFQCSNVLQLELSVEMSKEAVTHRTDVQERRFADSIQRAPARPAVARVQAIRVLSEVPQIAEKRSRSLVPIFLDWANRREDNGDAPQADHQAAESATLSPSPVSTRWSRSDQKAMLSLLAKFNNPRVLYKSAEVYAALLELLSSGDVDIQKPALEAVLTWKSPSVIPYQENLRNLLDDARFNEEVTGFVQIGGADHKVQSEHRAELMPVLLRMLYGRIIARKGAATGKKGMAGKRKMVMKALADVPDHELRTFIHIALGPLAHVASDCLREDGTDTFRDKLMSSRRQVGAIKMIEDLLNELGRRLAPFAKDLLGATLYCAIRASRELRSQSLSVHGATGENAEASLHKSIRQSGIKSLDLLFENCEAFNWDHYMPIIFDELVSPRLEKLPIETAQAPSGVIQLLSTWSTNARTVFFLADYDQTVLAKVADCLAVASAKSEVKLFVLSLIRNIVDLSESAEVSQTVKDRIKRDLLQPHVNLLLTRLGDILRESPGKDLLEAVVEIVYRLAVFVTDASEARNMVEISLFLLDQPLRRVNPKTKSDVLRLLRNLVPSYHPHDDSDLAERVFVSISALFGFFRDRPSREVLSTVLHVFAEKDTTLSVVADLCLELNSFSPTRIDEPDFERRLKAFDAINENLHQSFTARHWTPILHNMLYYVKDNEELAIRSSAGMTLRRFVEGAAAHPNDELFQRLTSTILLPALRNGAREASELVRAEFLTVIAHAIRHLPSHPALSDMSVLLVGDDEEASLFGNILHIQQHRRLRALRRLVGEVQQGRIASGNISHLLIPLIEHFIVNRADDGSAQNLAAETISTIGVLMEWVEWPQYKAILRRFVGHFESKPEPEKAMIRLLGVTIDALSRAAGKRKQPLGLKSATNGVEVHDTDLDDGLELTEMLPLSTLAATMPESAKLGGELTGQFINSMTKFLHDKDESQVSLRIPIAVTVVKLLKLLPSDQLAERLPPVLTDICHILRSRSQEARDLTRKTLTEITTLLGSHCFGFVLRELRGALARGYQLHVLSFTVHSILVANTTLFGPGDLDYCLPQIVGIIMDDIFGVTGQEKDAEEYISKMKEVRSSKSYDSMELIAKLATLQRLSDLVKPIQALLREKLSHSLVKKIDELLRRIGVGLLRNEAVEDRATLVFCYEIIQAAKKADAPSTAETPKDVKRTQRYLVTLKGAKKGGDRGSTTAYSYKITRFALDILRAVLHKYTSLQTPANLSAFIPIIGDSLGQTQEEEVQISALRLLTAIIRVPLPEIDRNTDRYIAEALALIRGSPSTNTELSQASLKLISAILRDRRSAELDGKKLASKMAFLIGRLKPDLEEPDRQGVTFNFLKAVMSRKVLIPEVYEAMDAVASIMVTNQTRSARDLSRGTYFQFLMEYPQGEKRFAKQMGFLVKNLGYQYPEGRQSVLETIHLMVSKIGDKLVQDVLGTFFVPLVMVLVNDESQECREMAGVLLKECFERADGDKTRTFLTLLRSWISQDEQTLLVRVSLQCYGFYLEVRGKDGAAKELPLLQTQLLHILELNAQDDTFDDWELLYFALQMLGRLCQLCPAQTFASSMQPTWTAVEECLAFPHAWVKLSAARLIGLYFADFARGNAATGLLGLPLLGSGGLQLDATALLQLTRKSLRMLRVQGISEDLAAQNVRNLLFLGRCLGANDVEWQASDAAGEGAGGTHDCSAASESEPDELDEPTAAARRPALHQLFSTLSHILRRDAPSPRASALIPKTSALALLASLASHLPVAILAPHLATLLLPLHNLTDTTIAAPHSFMDPAFNAAHKNLQQAAAEAMSVLQEKLGTGEYVRVYAEVRAGVKERREGRRGKRARERVTEPERVEERKKRKRGREKERRREKGEGERGKRRGW